MEKLALLNYAALRGILDLTTHAAPPCGKMTHEASDAWHPDTGSVLARIYLPKNMEQIKMQADGHTVTFSANKWLFVV